MSPRRLLLALLLAVIAWPALAAPDVRRVRGTSGVEAWLVRDATNPILHLQLAFKGGAALDPPGREGLARMVAALLDEGAGDLESQAFQKRLEDASISLSFSAGRDELSGTLKTLSRHRDEAFDLLRLALAAPRFDAEPVARIAGQLAVKLKRDEADPDSIAWKALLAGLFPGHPYGRPNDGTPDGVRAVTAEDLRGFVQRRLARDQLFIGVFGDITAEELADLLDRTFGGLPKTGEPARVPPVAPHADGTVRVIDAAVPQSVVLFGHAGLMRADPDFYAATVVDYVLGGGSFASRLFDEVREKRGLAYSVHTFAWPLDHAALYLGQAGTANERAAETLALIRGEWRRLAEGGMSAAELADAKTYLTGSFPLRFLSGARIAQTLVGMQTENLGIDYLEKRNGYIDAVTLDHANRVARRLLDPDALTFVVVGRPEGVAATR